MLQMVTTSSTHLYLSASQKTAEESSGFIPKGPKYLYMVQSMVSVVVISLVVWVSIPYMGTLDSLGMFKVYFELRFRAFRVKKRSSGDTVDAKKFCMIS